MNRHDIERAVRGAVDRAVELCIAATLERRSREVREFCRNYTKDPNHLGSVELALTREALRLGELAEAMKPRRKDREDQDR